MKFGENLKELRLAKGLTQKRLGEIFSVDQTSIVNWERGTNETDFNTLIKLAIYFNVSTDYLLGLEDEFGNKLHYDV